MSGNSYTAWDQGAHVSRDTSTAGACKGRDGNAYGCNEEQRATMAELGFTLDTAPRARGGKDEWEDALIKHKVMDAPLDHAKMRFMLEQKRGDDAFKESMRDQAAEMSKEELEDAIDEDEIDNSVFEKFRAQRMAEMKEQASKLKFGGLVHVTAQDYIPDVKFCKIKSKDANADYPDSCLPTLVVY